MSALEAGRELDALVAEKVMGWTDVSLDPRGNFLVTHFTPHGRPPEPPRNSVDGYTDIPPYSTDLAAAFQVVEKRSGFSRLTRLLTNDGWVWEATAHDDAEHNRINCYAETAPLAICLAALKAVEPK